MNKSITIAAIAAALTAGSVMVAGAQGDNSSARMPASSPLPKTSSSSMDSPASKKTSPKPKFSPNALASITPPNNSTGDSSK